MTTSTTTTTISSSTTYNLRHGFIGTKRVLQEESLLKRNTQEETKEEEEELEEFIEELLNDDIDEDVEEEILEELLEEEDEDELWEEMEEEDEEAAEEEEEEEFDNEKEGYGETTSTKEPVVTTFEEMEEEITKELEEESNKEEEILEELEDIYYDEVEEDGYGYGYDDGEDVSEETLQREEELMDELEDEYETEEVLEEIQEEMYIEEEINEVENGETGVDDGMTTSSSFETEEDYYNYEIQDSEGSNNKETTFNTNENYDYLLEQEVESSFTKNEKVLVDESIYEEGNDSNGEMEQFNYGTNNEVEASSPALLGGDGGGSMISNTNQFATEEELLNESSFTGTVVDGKFVSSSENYMNHNNSSMALLVAIIGILFGILVCFVRNKRNKSPSLDKLSELPIVRAGSSNSTDDITEPMNGGQTYRFS